MDEPRAFSLTTKNLWAKNPRRGSRGQAMTEFALVLPMLLVLLFGIIETGRLMVIYTSVASASREAARYAAAAGKSENGVPYYLDTAGIQAAARRLGALTGAINVSIAYDRGPDDAVGFTPADANAVGLGDRVKITVTSQYIPMLGVVPQLKPFTISSTASRTIVKEVSIGSASTSGKGTNNAPVVTILQPLNGSMKEIGQTITFRGTAEDPEDGTISNLIQWISSLDGVLGTGSTLDVSSLRAGEHTITAQVVDSDSNIGTASITLLINAPPLVDITAPANGSIFDEGEAITFTGTAIDDPGDGDLSDHIVWRIDGVQMASATATFNTSSLLAGTHTVIAQATDSGGLTGSKSITIAVVRNEPPTITIIKPASNTVFSLGASIQFEGKSTSVRGVDLSSGLTWTSSLDGAIGSGASFTNANLRAGQHTITVQSTDPANGLTGTVTFSIRVVDDAAPLVTITAPADGSIFLYGQPVTFNGTAQDTKDGDLTAKTDWISSLNGKFGTGGTASTSILDGGVHTIEARVIDSSGLVGRRSIVITIDKKEYGAPTLDITSPANDASFKANAPIALAGTATSYDGVTDLSHLIRWSFANSFVGQGATVTSTLPLTVGQHTLNAVVSEWTSSKTTIVTETVNILNNPPKIKIVAPDANVQFDYSKSIVLTAVVTETDPGQTDLLSKVVWTDDLSTELGRGGSITVNGSVLTPGRRTITARVSDGYDTAQDTRVIYPISCPGNGTVEWYGPDKNNFTKLTWNLPFGSNAPASITYQMTRLKLSVGNSSKAEVVDVAVQNNSYPQGNVNLPFTLPITNWIDINITPTNKLVQVIFYFDSKDTVAKNDGPFTLESVISTCPVQLSNVRPPQ